MGPILVETDVLDLADAGAWEAWLAVHHDGRPGGVWLRIAKRRSGRTSVTIEQALDVALCFGWIDSHRRAGDEDSFLQRYSPRRPRSAWSAINVSKAQALIAAGRMRPAGLAAVEAARADGRWARAAPSVPTRARRHG
jgi:uncharacterized protein YdeI (YjbR/CyaY-like superfamily)